MVALLHDVDLLLAAVGQSDFGLVLHIGAGFALRRLRAGRELDALARAEAALRELDPHVAVGELVFAREPQNDLSPESLVLRLESFHPPMPGRVAGKSHHAPAGLLHHQQRLAVGRFGQHLRGGLGLPQVCWRPRAAAAFPKSRRDRRRRQSPSSSVAVPAACVGRIFSGPGSCTSDRIASPSALPLLGIHLNRQQVGQRRVLIAARSKGVKSAQHGQARAAWKPPWPGPATLRA